MFCISHPAELVRPHREAASLKEVYGWPDVKVAEAGRDACRDAMRLMCLDMLGDQGGRDR